MNLKEITIIAEEIAEIAKMILEANEQLEAIKHDIAEGAAVSMKIEDAAYLDFSKEEVVLFLTNQVGILKLKLKALGEKLNPLLCTQ